MIRALIDAKATPEMILAAVEAVEKAEDYKKQQIKENRKERNRRYYEKKQDVLNRLKASQDAETSKIPLPSSSPLVPPLSPAPLSPPLIPPTSSNPAQSLKRAKPKITLDELSVDHIRDWLAKKRMEGKYLGYDEHRILEVFKDYCKAKNIKYDDYTAAYRNAFDWERCRPRAVSSADKHTRIREAATRGHIRAENPDF